MKLPIVLLCGQAGVGKDSIAQVMVCKLGFTQIAQADTIKHIAREVFGFTDQQLWGPSEFRNHLDTRWTPVTVNYEALRLAAGDPLRSSPGSTLGGGQDRVRSHLADAMLSSFGNHTQIPLTSAKALQLFEVFWKALLTFTESKGGLTPRIVLQLLGTEVGRAIDQNIWVDRAVARANQALMDGAPGVVVTDGRFRNEILGFRRHGAYAVKVFGDASSVVSSHVSEVEIADIPDHFYDLHYQNPKSEGFDGLERGVSRLLMRLFPDKEVISPSAVG